MATVIDCGNGSFIAGDPEVPVGYEACPWCFGTGLDDDGFYELMVCNGCGGTGRGVRLHPLVPVRA